ncbi:hypothetical protein [Nocardia sp. NPDC005998]|uniref:hypothetical protein n=1 Tax=Nocardia sp. NPDC005998 TaxID=3156894 RepID=UPI00339FB30B
MDDDLPTRDQQLHQISTERDTLERELGDLRARLCIKLGILDRRPGPQGITVLSTISDREIIAEIERLELGHAAPSRRSNFDSSNPSGSSSLRPSQDVHAYLLQRVNAMLRRLGMFGGEPALWAVFDHLYFLEGDNNGLDDLHESWRDRNAFTPTGARGALHRLLPDDLHSALPSMYAEAARRRGWLTLDRTLTNTEYSALRATIDSFTQHDHTWSDVLESFGEPSVLFGGTNPLYETTLAYASADPSDPTVNFHLWNGVEQTSEVTWPPLLEEPILLAIRCGTGLLPNTFAFTPEGQRRRPRGHETT